MRKKYIGAGFTSFLLVICLLVTLTTVMLTACSTETSSGTGPNPVKLEDRTFDPSSITIKKGESITLINDNVKISHTIENGTWDSFGTEKYNIEPGAPKVYMQIDKNSKSTDPFTTAGTFHLYCTVHPGMNLTVIVK